MSETTPDTSTQTPAKSSSGLAIAGLVLGIFALLTSFIPIVNNLSAIIAVIGGILAAISLVGAIRGKHTSKSMAIAGVVLAVVSFALVLITQSAFSSALNKASDKLQNGDKPVESSQSQSSSESQAEQSSKSDENKQGKDYSHMAIGETVKLENGLEITVTGVDRSQTKYDGSPLVCVTVSYNNTSDKSVSFNVFDWKCEDANGVQQSAYFNMNGQNELESGRLSAGGNVTGNVYFEGEPNRALYFSSILQTDSEIGWNI